MPIRKSVLCLLCISVFMSNAWSQRQVASASMNKVNLDFGLDKTGIPEYSVSFSGKQFIKSSRLGFRLNDGITSSESNFQIIKTDSIIVDETWKPVWGKVSSIRNHYSQINFHYPCQTALPFILPCKGQSKWQPTYPKTMRPTWMHFNL